MRLYAAGIFTSNFHKTGSYYGKLTDREREMLDSATFKLESYHYIHKQSMLNRIRSENAKVFLDSGAFSAFSQGVNIDIDRYCDYCKTNSDIIDFASVLDSIGSHKGTWENQMYIEKQGVNVLPCYHYGEPEAVLQYYIDRYEHFTIGGLVPISTQQMKIWLDRIWGKYLTNKDGTPKRKVHGFGVTSLPMMMRYPWYSVDSSTWVQWGAHGMILLPKSGKQIDISSRSSRRHIDWQHIDSVPQVHRQFLEDEIAAEGIDPDRLRDVNYSRWAWNAWAFPEFMRLRGGGCQAFEVPTMELF